MADSRGGSRPGSYVPSRPGSVMHDGTTGQLVRRNREIAEVREELDKMQKRLSSCQSRNKILLEESSELDSEVARQCARCAVSEQRTAELEDVARNRDELQTEQERKHEAAMDREREVLNGKDAELRRVETEAREHQQFADSAAMELTELRAALEAEDSAISAARARREGYSRPRDDMRPSLAVTMAADAERQALNERINAQTAEEAAAKKEADVLESELSIESRRREELGQQLRQAVSEQAERDRFFKDLQSALEARGGDAVTIFAEVREARAKLEAAEAEDGDEPRRTTSKQSIRSCKSDIGAERARDLRDEVQKVQEKKNSLDLNAQRLREARDQASIRLQSELDDARSQLQTSIRDAAQQNASEISRLEDEVQQERQKCSMEALAERQFADRIEELQRTKIETAGRGQLAAESRRQQELAEEARCKALSEELSTVKRECVAVEERLKDASCRATDSDTRRVKAQVEGDQRITKVRNMIEELWKEIRRQSFNAALQT